MECVKMARGFGPRSREGPRRRGARRPRSPWRAPVAGITRLAPVSSRTSRFVSSSYFATPWSKRPTALDTDLGRTLDSLSRQVLEEQHKDFAAQIEEIAAQMARIEQQLGK